MTRTPLSLVALILIAQLAACAQPPVSPLTPPGALPTADVPLPAPVATAPTQAVVTDTAEPARDKEPIIIRGNDRLVAPQPSASVGAVRGPVTPAAACSMT